MNKIALFICVAALAGTALADSTNTIVGGSLLNGDFNNPASDSNFDQLTNWVNIGTGASTGIATLSNDPYDSSHYAIVGGLPGVSVFGLDTGHTLAEGDLFDIAYVWKDGYLWSDGSDQIRVSLFVTDDDTIDGVRTDLATDLSGFSTANATYETVNHLGVYLATAADTDKTLFVAIDADIVDESYAQLDNFELIVRSDTTPPASPADLSVAAGDGYAFINWTANSETDLSGYNIYRSTSPGVYGAPLVSGLTDTEYLDETVVNGITYYYVVKAIDTGNNESVGNLEVSGLPMNYVIHSTKKGVGNSSGNKPLQKIRVESLNASWYYAWSMDRNFDMESAIEFAPMRHSKWWPDMAELANCGSFSNLLTYNEPDHKQTASDDKPTLQQALDFWPQFEAASSTYGCRISSPACSGTLGNDGQWVTNFMTQALAQGLQVDFMAYHRYPTPAGLANGIRNDCDALWATHGKPIWVTEFNGADWNDTGNWSMVDTYTTMIELLYYFESTPYVERYAVFPWDATWPAGAPSHIFEVEIDPGGTTNSTATLTPLGHLYAQYRASDINGPYVNTWYYLHNKGSKKHLRNNAGAPAMADIFTEDPSVEFMLMEAVGGSYFIVNRATGERLGYNGSSLAWESSSVADSTVQWSITDNVNGWDYINHPGTGKRLSGNPLAMVAGGTTGSSVQWSFVRSPSESEAAPVEVWASDALAGLPYSTDLSGYGSGSFSITSGPGWLNMNTNGLAWGTPAVGDTGSNGWLFVMTDGVNASTGTLHVAVKVATIVQYETFDGAIFQNADPQVFSAAEATTTVSNGTWIGNWSLPLNNARLRLYTPNDGDAIATRSILLDEALFADGAGTYILQFELKDLTLASTTLYIDLYDVDLDSGGSVKVDSYYWWALNSYTGLPGLVATNAPATVGLMTNLSWFGMSEGIETAEFEYDGSGDVLVNIGASKPSTAGTDWWQMHIDDLIIYGVPVSSVYELWTQGYGLSGTDAAATNDYDGDDWVNLLEFALGGNPTNWTDTGYPIQWEQNGGEMLYVYPRRIVSELTYWLETSDNLASNWIAGGYTELPETGSIDADFESVTNAVPIAGDAGFIRLLIE